MEWTNIRMIGDKENVRYVLCKEGSKPLVAIGVNPSTANEDNPDATMRKVMGFAEYNGFDSFIMINLYPQRTKDPNELHNLKHFNLIDRNKEEIYNAVKRIESPTVLAAWGNLINKRSYLEDCLRGIEHVLPIEAQWKCIRLSKSGEPVHPLYQKYCKLQDLDIIRYNVKRFQSR